MSRWFVGVVNVNNKKAGVQKAIVLVVMSNDLYSPRPKMYLNDRFIFAIVLTHFVIGRKIMITSLKNTSILFLTTLCFSASPSYADWKAPFCWDPVGAVLDTLYCVEFEDAECAAAGYSAEFVKLHNGVDTNTVIDGPEFWEGAFALVDFTLDFDHIRWVGVNEISLRYIEGVTTLGIPGVIDSKEFVQHEHALVTVDNDCKMIVWDQFGDNKEQTDVDDAVDELINIIFPQ